MYLIIRCSDFKVLGDCADGYYSSYSEAWLFNTESSAQLVAFELKDKVLIVKVCEVL